jgi:hypothetical protein
MQDIDTRQGLSLWPGYGKMAVFAAALNWVKKEFVHASADE